MAVDTIHITVITDILPDLDWRLISHPKTGEEIRLKSTWRGMKITSIQGKLRLRGSLSTLLYKNNLKTLSFKEVKEAIRILKYLIGEDIYEGTISRIDIHGTIETEHDPSSYFRYLGSAHHYKRIQLPEGSLYYKNGSREINFYDKKKQARSQKVRLPEHLRHQNLLRIEMRYKYQRLRNVSKKLGKSKLTINDLVNPNYYKRLIDFWKTEYDEINKVNKPILNLGKCRKKSDLLNHLASIGIEALGGETQVCDLIGDSRIHYRDIRPEDISNRKRDIRRLANLEGITEKSSLLKELNKKMESCYCKLLDDIELEDNSEMKLVTIHEYNNELNRAS